MLNNTSNEAKTYSNPYYFSLLTQNEQLHRPPNEDQIRGIRVRAASQSFRAAVRRLHTPRPAEMVLTGSVLPIPVQGELQITDERIGDEPYCYYRLSSSGDPRWIWGPDLRANVREIPIYRLQGGRS
jgi:hypothetical protein